MASTSAVIQVKGLGKKKISALTAQAQRLGLRPSRSVKQLVEQDLEIDRMAGTMTFDEILAPVGASFRASGITEQELDRLVDAARPRHHQRSARRRFRPRSCKFI